MTERDALDRILSSEDALAPSSGFAARVMDAVEEAAAEAPPLPFPWGRFGLAVLATCVSAASSVWLLQRVDLSPAVAALSSIWPEIGYAFAAFLAILAVLYAPYLRVAVGRLAAPRGSLSSPSRLG